MGGDIRYAVDEVNVSKLVAQEEGISAGVHIRNCSEPIMNLLNMINPELRNTQLLVLASNQPACPWILQFLL